jgi:hypothetical protein
MQVKPFPPLEKNEFIKVEAKEAQAINDHCEALYAEVLRLNSHLGRGPVCDVGRIPTDAEKIFAVEAVRRCSNKAGWEAAFPNTPFIPRIARDLLTRWDVNKIAVAEWQKHRKDDEEPWTINIKKYLHENR